MTNGQPQSLRGFVVCRPGGVAEPRSFDLARNLAIDAFVRLEAERLKEEFPRQWAYYQSEGFHVRVAEMRML